MSKNVNLSPFTLKFADHNAVEHVQHITTTDLENAYSLADKISKECDWTVMEVIENKKECKTTLNVVGDEPTTEKDKIALKVEYPDDKNHLESTVPLTKLDNPVLSGLKPGSYLFINTTYGLELVLIYRTEWDKQETGQKLLSYMKAFMAALRDLNINNVTHVTEIDSIRITCRIEFVASVVDLRSVGKLANLANRLWQDYCFKAAVQDRIQENFKNLNNLVNSGEKQLIKSNQLNDYRELKK